MRRFALMCILAMPAVALSQQRTMERRYAVTPTASIRLTAVSQQTTLRVVGWNRDSLALSGVVGSGSRMDGGVSQGGTAAKLFVESALETGGEPVRLELRVPERSRLWVKLGAGDVEVTAFRGAIDINVVSGTISVTGDLRELNAEAMDGSVSVAGRSAWLRAKTAAGAITVTGGGDDIGLTSVSGTVTLRGGPVARARLETITGDVLAAVAVEPGGQLTIDSHGGTVDYRLPPKRGADFDVATVHGTITNELTRDRPRPGMGGRGRELVTTSEDGGSTIIVRTFKGAVRLTRDTKER